MFRIPNLHLFCTWQWRPAIKKHFPLTKGLLGPHQAESEGYASRLLFKHLSHLVVSTANNALVIDGLDVVANTYRLQPVYGAAFLYPLEDTVWSISRVRRACRFQMQVAYGITVNIIGNRKRFDYPLTFNLQCYKTFLEVHVYPELLFIKIRVSRIKPLKCWWRTNLLLSTQQSRV